MKKDVIVGVIGALIGALFIFLAGSAFGLFTKKMTDTQLEEVSRLIVDEEKYRKVLLKKMKESEKFKGPQGLQGKQGVQGNKGEKGDSIWPDGEYCIFRGNASCPADFRQIDTHLVAISTHSTDNVKSGKFGSSKINLHRQGTTHPSNGDLYLSVCCK